MNASGQKGEDKKKINEVKTFTVPFPLEANQVNINSNTPSKPSKEQLINQAIQFHIKGNIREASKYYLLKQTNKTGQSLKNNIPRSSQICINSGVLKRSIDNFENKKYLIL